MKSIGVMVLFATACGTAGEVSSTPLELSAALPTTTWVAMTPEVSQPPAAELLSCVRLGASTFGALTHKIAADADGVLSGVLGEVHNITSTPPTAVAPGRAVWGPIPARNSSVYRLSVAEPAPAEFRFVLDGRDPKNDWRGVLAGATFVRDAAHRTGQIVVDFAVMHALDASTDPVEGLVTLHFDVNGPARSVAATFAGIRGKSAPQPEDSAYALVTAADHTSGFAYSTHVDFDGDGTPDELAHIDSQWTAAGAGVAHLIVSGGSLGTRVVNATECWDSSLSRLFYKDDAAMHPAVGDISCCPR